MTAIVIARSGEGGESDAAISTDKQFSIILIPHFVSVLRGSLRKIFKSKGNSMEKGKEKEGIRVLKHLSREELIDIIVDDAHNWLAHDGLWFQAVEAAHGMDAAMDADREAWRRFTVIEAGRIMKRLGLEPGGGRWSCEDRRLRAGGDRF